MLASIVLPVFLAFMASADPQALPPLAVFLQDVRIHQRDLDKMRESYTFRELETIHQLDKHGGVKKEEKREYNVIFVHGHPIRTLIRRNGAALSTGDQDHESDRIEHKVALAERTPPGDPLNAGREVSVARLLQIERFQNERRVMMDNRPMIAIDFVGDPHADTHGVAEDASKHLSGTLWIDERDREVRRVEARLDSNFHMAIGLVSLDKGSTFAFEQKIVNNEVWLPTGALVRVEAHAGFFLSYHVQVTLADDQYRRFQASADENRAAQKK